MIEIRELKFADGIKYEIAQIGIIFNSRQDAEKYLANMSDEKKNEIQIKEKKRIQRAARRDRRREREEARGKNRANDPKQAIISAAVEEFGGWDRVRNMGFDISTLYVAKGGNIVGFNHLREGWKRLV